MKISMDYLTIKGKRIFRIENVTLDHKTGYDPIISLELNGQFIVKNIPNLYGASVTIHGAEYWVDNYKIYSVRVPEQCQKATIYFSSIGGK